MWRWYKVLSDWIYIYFFQHIIYFLRNIYTNNSLIHFICLLTYLNISTFSRDMDVNIQFVFLCLYFCSRLYVNIAHISNYFFFHSTFFLSKCHFFGGKLSHHHITISSSSLFVVRFVVVVVIIITMFILWQQSVVVYFISLTQRYLLCIFRSPFNPYCPPTTTHILTN